MKPLAPQVVPEPDFSATRVGLILYVEDDFENWNAAHLRLQSRYQLVHAATDIEACEVVRRQGQDLTAILMDIELKGSVLNGIELTRLFRGNAPTQPVPPYATGIRPLPCPIVFVTAYGSRYPEPDLLAAGGNKRVEKPVDFLKLTLALASFNASSVIEATVKR